jgi:hypothetical protein
MLAGGGGPLGGPPLESGVTTAAPGGGGPRGGPPAGAGGGAATLPGKAMGRPVSAPWRGAPTVGSELRLAAAILCRLLPVTLMAGFCTRFIVVIRLTRDGLMSFLQHA